MKKDSSAPSRITGPAGSASLRRDVLWAHEQLQRLYGPVRFRPGGDTLDQLIQTVLSQNTSDVNSDRAFSSLKTAFPVWTDALRAPPAKIAQAIRSGGLANIKAPRIKAILAEILRREGALTLTRVRRMPVADALDYLTSLPGVGMKTASAVLLFSLGRPVMPVDTHVHRVTRRLGWAPWSASPDRVQPILESALPPRLILSMHLLLVTHGRRTCKAGRPLCQRCPLRRRCAFAKMNKVTA